MRSWSRPALAALCLLLAGCAHLVNPTSLAPGTTAQEVEARLGQPTARYPAGDGAAERWQYSMQPAGQRVYNLDLDASGHLVRAEQALNEALFDTRIQPDAWTRAEVLREYGPPARTMRVHGSDSDIWVWRYTNGPFWRLLFIDLDPQGMVREYSLGDEHIDPPERR